MFSRGQKYSLYSVWQWNDMGHSSLNSDICCKQIGTWPLRLSEHRQELACEACLRQLYRQQPSTVEYGLLFRCRHNATHRSVKVGHKISQVLQPQRLGVRVSGGAEAAVHGVIGVLWGNTLTPTETLFVNQNRFYGRPHLIRRFAHCWERYHNNHGVILRDRPST